jgi:intein/homing endonuclease
MGLKIDIREVEELSEVEKLALQNFSYSRLNTYDWCPAQYFFNYVLKYPQEYGAKALLGNVVHKALEITLRDGEVIDKAELLDNYRAAREEYDPDYSIIDDELYALGIDMLERHVEGQAGAPTVITTAELDFEFVFAGVLFRGYIDKVVVTDTEVIIDDYKCFPGDTLVQMATGEERYAKDIRVGDLVVGFDNGKFIKTKVTDIFDNGVKKTLTIHTKNGRKLTCTENHPILTDNGFVKASNLAIGRKLVSNIDTYESSNWFLPTSGDMSYQEAYSLGLLTGDGTTTGVSGFRFTSADTVLVSSLNKYLGETFNLELKNHEGNGTRPYDYDIQGLPRDGKKNKRIDKANYRKFLEENELLGHNAHTKTIGPKIMRGGPEVWKAFLSGYLDTDGSVRYQDGVENKKLNPNVAWHSVSRELLEKTQTLLSYLGVRSQLLPINSWYKKDGVKIFKPSFRLTVSNRAGVVKLAGMLKPMVEHKVENFKKIIKDSENHKKNIFLPEDQYDVISKIEANEPEPTIGLTVDGNHTHVTQGIVTHNTGKWEVSNKDIPSNLQLGIYALYLKYLYPDKQVTAALMYMQSEKRKKHTFTDEDFVDVQNRLHEAVGQVRETNNFLPTRAKWKCKICSYAKDGTCGTGRKVLKDTNKAVRYESEF